MCDFLYLAFADDAARTCFARFSLKETGRRAPRPGFTSYTLGGHCACHLVNTFPPHPDSFEKQVLRKRFEGRGWSETKIERASKTDAERFLLAMEKALALSPSVFLWMGWMAADTPPKGPMLQLSLREYLDAGGDVPHQTLVEVSAKRAAT